MRSRDAAGVSDSNVKQRRTHSSCPAIAGKGDHLAKQGGGRGVELDDTLFTTAKRRVRRPLHRTSCGLPPPLSQGRKARHRRTNEKKSEGSGTPTDAGENCPHQRVRGAPRSWPACADPPLRARSPVGVPLTALRQGLPPLTCGSRPGFLGRGRSAGLFAPPSGGRTERSLCGRYPPHLSQSSRCTRQSGPSAVLHDARNRPGADRNSARGHRPRSSLQVYLPTASFMSEMIRHYVTETVTYVNRAVTKIGFVVPFDIRTE